MVKKIWGWELIVDARSCNKDLIGSRANITEFVTELVARIKMKSFGEPIIEHFATHDPLKGGFSLVQLIETSNITAHFVDLNGDSYFNVFSCMEFDEFAAIKCIEDFFKPTELKYEKIERSA